MYLVLASCFSFGEGRGKKSENHNCLRSRKYVNLKARGISPDYMLFICTKILQNRTKLYMDLRHNLTVRTLAINLN